MSGVGTPDLFSGESRLNTLGKLETFFKDLRLSVQKIDMPELLISGTLWSLPLNMMLITPRFLVQFLSRPFTQESNSAIIVGPFLLRIFHDSLLSKGIDVQNTGPRDIRLCIINLVLSKCCTISSL